MYAEQIKGRHRSVFVDGRATAPEGWQGYDDTDRKHAKHTALIVNPPISNGASCGRPFRQDHRGSPFIKTPQRRIAPYPGRKRDGPGQGVKKTYESETGQYPAEGVIRCERGRATVHRNALLAPDQRPD
jgi:hypothetical protein